MEHKPRRLKILLITQYFWPENFRINDFVTSLVERGHEVTVLTGKPNYPGGEFFRGYSFRGVQSENYMGAEVVRVPLVSRGRGRGLRLVLNYISFVFFAVFWGMPKILKKKYDFVFAHQLSPVTICLPGIFYKLLKRVPLFIWVQDLWPESLQATGAVKSRGAIGLVGQLVKFIYNKSDAIFVQSMGFIDAISKRGVPLDKIFYMPNWAEDVFVEPKTGFKEDLPQLVGEFKIVFAGNIGEAQDFPTILQTAERLKTDPRIQWYILGDGRKKSWVEAEAERRNLKGCFHLMGSFPLETMPSFYQQADVLLVSLKREPIFSLTVPGKIQSYLACGKPILASLDGEGARVISEAGAGLASPAESPEELAKCILRLLNKNSVERAVMGQSGFKYFQSHFNRKNIISDFENKAHELLD